jgi:Leucine-rich repeat (LRR) protein
MIALQVKRNKDRFEFDVDANATVDDVFSSIEEKTNALKRTMKLIVNGKTLTAFDDGKKIFAEVVKKKGSKVTAMLLDGAPLVGGGGSTSAGAAMASSVAEKRRREAKEKMMAQKDERAKERKSKGVESSYNANNKSSNWEKTGICSSQNSGLDALPTAALEALRESAKVKVFDFSLNAIALVPNSIITLPALQNVTRVSLCNNAIESAGIDFKVLFENLRFLKYLDVSNNNLSGAMDVVNSRSEEKEKSKRPPLQLKISNNKITSFSSSFFKSCPPLERFDASGNQVNESIEHYFVGSETTLAHINLANNFRINAIPNAFRNMKSLQSLILDGNKIDKKGIPAVVLRECDRLSELSLKQNQVTIEELRELDGWDAYNERRVSRADKILDAKTMLGDASFREGADAERYTRDF